VLVGSTGIAWGSNLWELVAGRREMATRVSCGGRGGSCGEETGIHGGEDAAVAGPFSSQDFLRENMAFLGYWIEEGAANPEPTRRSPRDYYVARGGNGG